LKIFNLPILTRNYRLMKLLGNVLWLVFGGLLIAIEYFIASLILMITIIGIPFGIQSPIKSAIIPTIKSFKKLQAVIG